MNDLLFLDYQNWIFSTSGFLYDSRYIGNYSIMINLGIECGSDL